jgi:plastocyanin
MKKAIVAIAIVIIIVIGWVAFKGKNDNKTNNSAQTNNSTPSQSQTSNNNQNQNSSQPTATDSVTIKDLAFSPQNITVKKGTKVTWTNQDSTSHTVTETDGKNGPSSSTLSNGQSYSFTFNETGTFAYHCSIHNEMTGTVVVTE